MNELPAALVAVAVFDGAPGQYRRRRSHGESELDVIAGVEPAAGQVFAHVCAVVQRRIPAPRDAAPGRLAPRYLRFVKEERFLQRFGVIESWSLLRVGSDGAPRAGE